MQRASLTTLLERNQAHVDRIAEDRFDDLQEGQAPELVSVCCSDSRVSQEGMFDVDEAGWLFTSSNIGNQVWDRVDGERVVDGNVLYPLEQTGTRSAAVVGHTGCGAITAAYSAVRGEAAELASGIAKRVALLGPVVKAALDREPIDTQAPEDEIVHQLVEANVHAQVRFLSQSGELPEDVDVFGFVYDLHGAYGGPRGRAYLVNVNEERELENLRSRVPGQFRDHAATLLAEPK